MAAARLTYLDWLRGVAVLIMILWHVVDSWTVIDGRDTRAFHAVIFTAGWAAPLFLFLAGTSVPLAAAASVGRGLGRSAAGRKLQRRGWEVFVLAHLFRFQSFVLNPSASWNSLLKPDILNVLGIGIVVTAWCWTRAGSSTRSQALWLLGPAVVVTAVLTPLAPTWWWPTLLHPRLEAYIRPVGNYGVFSLFPAIAYVLVGGFVGSRIHASRESSGPFHARLMAAGAAVLLLAWLLERPPVREGAIWAGPVSAVSGRMGTMMVAMAICWWAIKSRPAGTYSPVVLLGRTSLFVYWIHVELAYGAFSLALRQRLTLGWSLVGYAVVTWIMYQLAVRWSRRARGPLVPEHLVAEAPGRGSRRQENRSRGRAGGQGGFGWIPTV